VGVAKRPRERSPTRNPTRYDSQLLHRCMRPARHRAHALTATLARHLVSILPPSVADRVHLAHNAWMRGHPGIKKKAHSVCRGN
jgi:hypothetical protein